MLPILLSSQLKQQKNLSNITNSLLFLPNQLFQPFYNEIGSFLPGQASFLLNHWSLCRATLTMPVMTIGYCLGAHVTAVTSTLGISPRRLHHPEHLGLLESTTVTSANKQILVLTRIPDHRYYSRSLRRASNQLSMTQISIG